RNAGSSQSAFFWMSAGTTASFGSARKSKNSRKLLCALFCTDAGAISSARACPCGVVPMSAVTPHMKSMRAKILIERLPLRSPARRADCSAGPTLPHLLRRHVRQLRALPLLDRRLVGLVVGFLDHHRLEDDFLRRRL